MFRRKHLLITLLLQYSRNVSCSSFLLYLPVAFCEVCWLWYWIYFLSLSNTNYFLTWFRAWCGCYWLIKYLLLFSVTLGTKNFYLSLCLKNWYVLRTRVTFYFYCVALICYVSTWNFLIYQTVYTCTLSCVFLSASKRFRF